MRLVFLTFFLQYSYAFKYLIISPIYSYSHVKFMSNIADTLADHGHEVVVFQQQIVEALRDKKVIKNPDIKIINYEANTAGKEFYRNRPKSSVTKYWTTNQAANPSAADQFAEAMSKDLEHMCLQVFEDKSLHTMLKSEHFDVLLAEPFDPCGLYLGDYLKIPSTIVAMASSRIDPVQWALGQPSGLNFIPGPDSKYGEESGVWDRINNVWMFFMRTRMFRAVYWNLLDKLRFKTGLEIRNIDEIVAESAYLFYNSNPYLDFPFPSLTKCVPIGGFSMNTTNWKSENLPENLKNILQKRPNTVFISFGSVIRSADMPQEYKNAIIEVTKLMSDVTFIWKYEDEKDEEMRGNIPENVHLMKWLPQPALLEVSSIYEYDQSYDYPSPGSTNFSIYDGFPFDEEMCSSEECLIDKSWTSEEKCEYIKCNQDSCEGGGYLTWSHYVKCQYNIGVRVILIILGILYLIILFVIMSSIADDFFCPAISGIVSHLRMSESIAGVTFLAFGNGAPDVFSSISSVLTTPKPKADLALGDLFGTSIFVTTVVLAIIIFTKSFKVAIIPTLRDLIFYMTTLAFIVFCFLKFDKIEVWMPATFLGIYGVYVVTVIILGIYRTHRKKRNLKKKNKELEDFLSRPSSAASTTPIFGAMKLKEETISVSALFHFMIGYSQFIKNLTRANLKRTTNNNNNDNKNEKRGIVNLGFSEPYSIPSERKISTIFKQNTFETDLESLESLADLDGSDDEGREEKFGYAHHTVFTSHDQISLVASEIEEIEITTWRSWDWVWDLFNHLKSWPSRDEFSEMNIFIKIVTVIKVVPVFFFKLTVPSNEMSWCKPLFILHCFASIQFALFSIQIITLKPFDGSPGLWLYGLGFSAILAMVAMYFLPLSKEQKYYKEIYSYLGFLMSIAWIYATSNEIVSVVTMIGVVTGLSMELLGLTIMAWSNCIGDIVADIAVVKQGYPKMAMAAAIGGPLFNLLIGFGLPFTIAAAQGKEMELLINPVYRLLMLFLGISLVTTFVALFIQRFTVRRPHAVLLIFIFVVFLIFICLAEFHVLEWN